MNWTLGSVVPLAMFFQHRSGWSGGLCEGFGKAWRTTNSDELTCPTAHPHRQHISKVTNLWTEVMIIISQDDPPSAGELRWQELWRRNGLARVRGLWWLRPGVQNSAHNDGGAVRRYSRWHEQLQWRSEVPSNPLDNGRNEEVSVKFSHFSRSLFSFSTLLLLQRPNIFKKSKFWEEFT